VRHYRCITAESDKKYKISELDSAAELLFHKKKKLLKEELVFFFLEESFLQKVPAVVFSLVRF